LSKRLPIFVLEGQSHSAFARDNIVKHKDISPVTSHRPHFIARLRVLNPCSLTKKWLQLRTRVWTRRAPTTAAPRKPTSSPRHSTKENC